MFDAASTAWANPSSVHHAGRRARALVDETRERLAALLAIHPRDVALTSGGTEANNLALHSATALVTSRIEHPSVVRVAESLERRGVPVSWLPVSVSGRIEPDSIDVALTHLPSGAWVAVMAANHEAGVIQPIAEIAERVHRHGAKLHVDAVQALGKISVEALGVADSIAVAAHKIRGPKGIGALAWRGIAPKPLVVGGAQERGIRPGTQDAALAAGFSAALEHAGTSPTTYESLASLRDVLEQALAPHATVNGEASPRLPHVSNMSFRGWGGAELVAALDLAGLRVSSGSACSAGTTEPSPVIEAMLGRERALSSVRFSLGETSDRALVERAIRVVERVVRNRSS
jgi:cysteine desulfurase